jgi:murein DD-endopeptidase MepM/ murein hydrolase activator NlpD
MALQLRSPVTEPLHEFGWPRPSSGEQANDFRITSPFGWRDDPLNPGTRVHHGGLDIGNGRLGYPLVATADGIVVAAGFVGSPWSVPSPPDKVATWGPTYGGNMVVIRHDGGVISLYAHMDKRFVNAGDRVTKRQRVGTVGQSGSAWHAGHLHFGLQVGGKWVDPEPHVRLGEPIRIEDDDMVFFTAANSDPIVNRDCHIRAGTNVRSRPNLSADTIVGFIADSKLFRPAAKVNGADANGSRVWYWGPVWVPERGFSMIFVHASRCTPLNVAEKTGDDTSATRIRDKDAALTAIKERADSGLTI